MLKHFTNKKGFTTYDVIIAFVIASYVLVNATEFFTTDINVDGNQELRSQAVKYATEGIWNVEKIIKTNKRRFAPPECWKTIATEDVCDPLTSPMMATVGYPVEEYAVFTDHIDGTASLIAPAASGEFEDNVVEARESNSFSLHKLYTGPNNTESIVTSDVLGSENTYFYRQIRIGAHEVDVDADGVYEEALAVTSTVKWPYKNKINSISVSRRFINVNY